MLRFILLLALFPALHAELIEVPAEFLDSNSIELLAGDELRVYATEIQDAPNLNNLNWTGGTLHLDGCRFEGSAARSNPFPLTIHTGQHLELSATTIQQVDTALVLAGGDATLSNVTLAANTRNIRCQDPASQLVLHDVNICNAAIGVELLACQSADFEDVLFLTNDLGIQCTAGNLSLQNLLFQANYTAIRIAPGATHPTLGDSVDFVDARDFLIENQDALPFELGTSHLSHPNKTLGPTTRSGADPGAPRHVLETADPPVVIGDDSFLEMIVQPQGPLLSTNGVPCRISAYVVYVSEEAYCCFIATAILTPGESYSIPKNPSMKKFVRSTSLLGEWD